jgi:hypothetical protein
LTDHIVYWQDKYKMDNQLTQQPLAPVVTPQPKKLPIKLLIIGSLLLGIFILFGILMFPKNKAQQDQTSPTSHNGDSSTASSKPASATIKTVEEPLEVVRDITANIKTGTLEKALPFFFIDSKFGYTKEQVLTLLGSDKTALTDKDGYRPLISRQNIEITDTEAQILVEYPVDGRIFTSRYDLEKKGSAWKVVKVVYNERLNLSTIDQAESFQNTVEKRVPYSNKPISLNLPNGDNVIAQKTLLSLSKDEDYYFTFNNPKSSYVMVIYDKAHPIVIEYINKGEIDKNANHAFDVSDLGESGGGMVAIYPEGKTIDRSHVGIADGTLLMIPVKVTK